MAERLGIDPVTVFRETDWGNRSIRTAAAIVAWRDDETRDKAQTKSSKN